MRGSSLESKQSFLKKKGLTEAEITEALKRVPEASDTTVGAPDNSTTGQLAQISRPAKAFPIATASGQPYVQTLAPQQALQPAGYRWSQVSFASTVPEQMHRYRLLSQILTALPRSCQQFLHKMQCVLLEILQHPRFEFDWCRSPWVLVWWQ